MSSSWRRWSKKIKIRYCVVSNALLEYYCMMHYCIVILHPTNINRHWHGMMTSAKQRKVLSYLIEDKFHSAYRYCTPTYYTAPLAHHGWGGVGDFHDCTVLQGTFIYLCWTFSLAAFIGLIVLYTHHQQRHDSRLLSLRSKSCSGFVSYRESIYIYIIIIITIRQKFYMFLIVLL